MTIRHVTSTCHQGRAGFVKLLKAAVGKASDNAASSARSSSLSSRPSLTQKRVKKPPLPIFKLHPDHIRIFSSPSKKNNGKMTTTVSSTPTEFHSHLCNSIRNAKRRVKLAALYIGAGNGCMSLPKQRQCMENNPLNPSPREEQLLQELHDLSLRSNDNNDKMEIKVVMDESRATRPIRIVQKESSISSSSSSSKDHRSEKYNDNIGGGNQIQMTSSAKEVYYALFPPNNKSINNNNGSENNLHPKNKGVSLFQVHRGIEAMLPSPLNEVMGVFHLKVYIVDDELILSGANLSEEYFTDRLDRYMSFTNGANGLVDFYSDLIDIIYEHSTPYHPSSSSSSSMSKKQSHNSSIHSYKESSLNDAIVKHFDGSDSYFMVDGFDVDGQNDNINDAFDDDAFAYAIPTFQPSQRFLKQHNFTMPQDVHVIRDVILAAKENFPNSSLFISSAYLNPTHLLISAIERFISNVDRSVDGNNSDRYNGSVFFLSAAPKSHGFKPKEKDEAVNGSGRGWIPSVFMKLAEEMHSKLSFSNGKVLLYERDGYTFHAKGLWLTSSSYNKSADNNSSFESNRAEEKKIVDPENDLLVSVIGSSNYGSRSEILDFESNCVLVMNPLANDAKSKQAKLAIAGDWNSMLDYHVEYGSRDDLGIGDASAMSNRGSKAFALNVVTQIVRRFF